MIEPAALYYVKVEHNHQLDQLVDRLPCLTREGDDTLLIDLSSTEPDQDQMFIEITGVSPEEFNSCYGEWVLVYR